MTGDLKTFLRSFLPKSYQVPAKYWYGWFWGTLEEEMKLIGLLIRRLDRVVEIGKA